jgi:Protein of unknown function (DUF3192)
MINFITAAFIFFMIFFSSCSRSPIATGVRAEENRYNLSWVEVGMSQNQVLCRAGGPQRIEKKEINGVCYEIWYYLTKRYGLGQTRLLPQNTTPLIFKNKKLIGWGREYYRYLLNIDHEKEKRQDEEMFEYSDDDDEWPPNQHTQVPEPPPQAPLPLKSN